MKFIFVFLASLTLSFAAFGQQKTNYTVTKSNISATSTPCIVAFNPTNPRHYGGTTKAHLKLTIADKPSVKRSIIKNDNNTATQWVIKYNGNVVLERNARNEMNYAYFRTNPGKYTVHLEQFIGGKYVVISNVVGYKICDPNPPCITAFKPTNPRHYGGTTKAKLTLTLSDNPSVERSIINNDNNTATQWVIKYNNNVVLKRNARNEMNYAYFRTNPGKYTVHLEQFIGGKYVVISNVVGYRICDPNPPCITAFKPTNPRHYGGRTKAKLTLTLSDNPSVKRSVVRNDTGGLTQWVIKYNNTVVLKRNASNEINYAYFRTNPGTYTVHLEQFIGGKYVVISNVVGYRICDE